MRRTRDDIFRQPLESSFSSISLKSAHRRREKPSDDRNLVGVEGGYEGADFEERILLFWENYRRIIIGTVAVVFSVVLVYQLTVYLDERRESALRAAYQLAEDREERLAFAKEHAGHPLAGFAYLEVANEKFPVRNMVRRRIITRRRSSLWGNLPWPAGRTRVCRGGLPQWRGRNG